jgi:hypothetical protein
MTFNPKAPLDPYVTVSVEPESLPATNQPKEPVAVKTGQKQKFRYDFGESDPYSIPNALSHRDGIDGICAVVEWIQHLRNTGQSNDAREALYQKHLKAEIEYWRLFATPDAKRDAERVKKALAELWTYPLKLGRQWSAATITLAVSELGLEV